MTEAPVEMRLAHASHVDKTFSACRTIERQFRVRHYAFRRSYLPTACRSGSCGSLSKSTRQDEKSAPVTWEGGELGAKRARLEVARRATDYDSVSRARR
jgi:hypothetical protein